MLENVDRILGRMQQIERRMQSNPVSGDFNQLMQSRLTEGKEKKQMSGADAASKKMNQLSGLNLINAMNPAAARALGVGASGASEVKPLAQHNNVSCGQTSVAMCINAVTGKNMEDWDIDNKHGFELLSALNAETKQAGYSWRDGGEVSAKSWDLIDHKVNNEKIPVIVALNGPEFSASGRGHIVTIVKTEGDAVTFADPATGALKTTTKQNMNAAPSHPDGNFVFYGVKGNQPNLSDVLPFS